MSVSVPDIFPGGKLPKTRRVKAFKMPDTHGGNWVPILWSKQLSADEIAGIALLGDDPIQTMVVRMTPASFALLSETEVRW